MLKKAIMDYNPEYGPAVMAFIIIFVGQTLFLVMFEVTFYILLLKMQYAGKYEIWFFQVIEITVYATVLYSTSHSRFARFIYFLLVVVASCVILGMVIWFKAFSSTKILITLILAFHLIGLIISIKTKGVVLYKVEKRSIFLIVLLGSSSIVSAGFMSFVPRYVDIDPDSQPELIFWCGTSDLPDDEETLEMCKKYNIAFAPTIRDDTVGDNETMTIYKNLIKYEINLYFAIGGKDDFYCHIDSAKDFTKVYKNIRNWFVAEEIMESSYVKGFMVDAETKEEIVEEIEGNGPIDSTNYLTDNYPTREEINEAEEAMQKFTEEIREDGKDAGLVRIARVLDESDGDDDMNLLTRNIYGMDIDWDFTVTMLYRTNRADAVGGIEPGDNKDIGLLLNEIFLGSVIEGVKYTTSDYSFYHSVAIEQTKSEVNVNIENQFIFIGNFKSEFNETTYIKEKQYFGNVP